MFGKTRTRPDEPATSSGAAERFDLFAAAIEALPDPVLIYSADTPGAGGLKIIATNAAARDLLRIRDGDDRLVGVLRQPELLEAADHTVRTGAPHDLAYEQGGAQPRYWRALTKPLPPSGERRFALLVLHDETKARRLERVRADFLANASHELRTPLASLTGFIETLQGHAKDDPAARDRFLGIMAGQANRMRRLLNDLLSLSRIELNEHVPPADVCDAGLLVSEAAESFAPLLCAKGVELQLASPPPGEALAVGDRDQIAQVVQNLVDNAVKYSPSGGAVSIEVTPGVGFEADDDLPVRAARIRDAGGGRLALVAPDRAHARRYVRLTITDQGAGLQRECLPRLTERFYRAPGQKSGELSGTGLGLAIVRHIVNRHRGGLVVESAPGRGAAFLVYLPEPAPPGAARAG